MNTALFKVAVVVVFLGPVDSKTLIDYVKPENIIQNLHDFTIEPHVAGTSANRRVAEKILDKWRSYGLEDVHFDSYKVLLSYPNYTNPNHIRLWDSTGNKLFESTGVSPAILPSEQGAPHAGVQWLAYSANGTFRGLPIYCNYGTVEDFQQLSKMNISLKNRIALIRYGRIFRGDKIRLAQEAGASAAIIYSDPQDCAPDGIEEDHVYPRTDYMPPHGAQRGSLKEMDGDPLTPFYPARKDLYYSLTIHEIKKLGKIPSIPVLPLSYGDAVHVLSKMRGRKVPEEGWQGGFSFAYSIGDEGLQDGIELEVEVHSTLERRTIQNVIGYIRGEYVCLIKVTSQSILLVVAGLIGSAEFVESYQSQLTQRAVAYLNVDLIFGNGTFYAKTVPTMFDVVVENAKKIPNPVKSELAKGRKTVYDTWVHTVPGRIEDRPDLPELEAPGGGSDHERFASYLGVPVVDFRFVRSDRNPKTNTTYPLYHSLYETPFVNEHIFDHDNFAVHTATAQYWINLAKTLSESPVIPLNISMLAYRFLDGYARDLKADIDTLSKQVPEGMEKVHTQVMHLIRKIQEFVRQAAAFHSRILGYGEFVDNSPSMTKDRFWVKDGSNCLTEKWSLEEEIMLRFVNDRLMSIDRCFVVPTAVPNAPLKRNILFSTNDFNTYDAKVMPAVYDQIDALRAAKLPKDRKEIIKKLTEQISIVQFGVQCAITSLGEFL